MNQKNEHLVAIATYPSECDDYHPHVAHGSVLIADARSRCSFVSSVPNQQCTVWCLPFHWRSMVQCTVLECWSDTRCTFPYSLHLSSYVSRRVNSVQTWASTRYTNELCANSLILANSLLRIDFYYTVNMLAEQHLRDMPLDLAILASQPLELHQDEYRSRSQISSPK